MHLYNLRVMTPQALICRRRTACTGPLAAVRTMATSSTGRRRRTILVSRARVGNFKGPRGFLDATLALL